MSPPGLCTKVLRAHEIFFFFAHVPVRTPYCYSRSVFLFTPVPKTYSPIYNHTQHTYSLHWNTPKLCIYIFRLHIYKGASQKFQQKCFRLHWYLVFPLLFYPVVHVMIGSNVLFPVCIDGFLEFVESIYIYVYKIFHTKSTNSVWKVFGCLSSLNHFQTISSLSP